MSLRKLGIFFLILAAYSQNVEAKRHDENVVITAFNDEYTFSDKRNEVIHSRKIEYQATRHSETVQPHIFYNNIIKLDKAAGGKAQYRNANSPNVFHDDSKVCYFNIFLSGKDKKGKAEFKRTFTDAAHFTGVFFPNEYPILSGTVTFNIPSSLNGIELIDENFPSTGIDREETVADNGSRRITYSISQLPKEPSDPSSPDPLIHLPHISVKGYFPDTDSLYRYHKNIIDVDTVIADSNTLLPKLLASAESRIDTIAALYRFVQQSIRYVAYEEGEAAFRPETPAETLKKRYGDCKSMSLLLATLLNRSGIEAYIATVGTNSIPRLISDNPSLAAANHMICIVPDGGRKLFLDPTHEQISANHVPEWIRGKDAMMFTHDGYEMVTIPTSSPNPSDDIMTYTYFMDNSLLTGRVNRKLTEDMAEAFYSAISQVPSQRLDGILAKNLLPSYSAKIPADSIVMDRSTPGLITLDAPLINSAAINEIDGCIYLDLNTSNDPFTERVDTADRHSDYMLPLTGKITRRCNVSLPKGYKIVLPANYGSSCPQAKFSCEFSQNGNSVTMTKTMEITSRRIPIDDIPSWNRLLSEWDDHCNNQIELINENHK